jgi:hypothetical protein
MTRVTPAVNARAAAVAVVLCALAGCAANPPALQTFVQQGLPPQVELDGTPFFAQDRYQCGPAVLATVLAASGVEVTADELVREVYLPGRRGSLQPELVAATRSRGRVPYVLPPETSALLAVVADGTPVLVLQKLGAGPWPGWHYAVLVGYDAARDRVVLRSGLEPRKESSAALFLASWGRGEWWALAALHPGAIPPRADLGRYMEAAAGLEAAGRPQDALPSYEAAARHWPEAALPRLALANLAFAGGDVATAERGYREAIRFDPGNVAARNNRAEALNRMGCPAAARREIEAARELAAGGPLAQEVEATAREIPAAPAADRDGCPAH